jgi:hypothetical protein
MEYLPGALLKKYRSENHKLNVFRLMYLAQRKRAKQ